MYTVTVAFCAHENDWEQMSDELEKVAGECLDSGCGFGIRDMEWKFEKKEDADTAVKKLAFVLLQGGFELRRLDVDEPSHEPCAAQVRVDDTTEDDEWEDDDE